jgi:hypothetical protein
VAALPSNVVLETVVDADRRIRIVGDLAGELIHLGQSVMHAGDTIDGSSTRRWPCRLALMCISTWRMAGYNGQQAARWKDLRAPSSVPVSSPHVMSLQRVDPRAARS